jgi:hypothetical protein
VGNILINPILRMVLIPTDAGLGIMYVVAAPCNLKTLKERCVERGVDTNHTFIPTVGVLIGLSDKKNACAAVSCQYRPTDKACGWGNLPLLEILEDNPVMPDNEELREELFKFLRRAQHHTNKSEVLSWFKTAEDEEDEGTPFVPPAWPKTASRVLTDRWPVYVKAAETQGNSSGNVRGKELTIINGKSMELLEDLVVD